MSNNLSVKDIVPYCITAEPEDKNESYFKKQVYMDFLFSPLNIPFLSSSNKSQEEVT